MMAVTISTHFGSSVAISHNIRDRNVTDKEPHIDPDGEHEIWKHETLADAYHVLFDDAVEEYNRKQKRDDRKIDSYYGTVRRHKDKHLAYEEIITVGNRDNPIDQELGKTILKEYVSEWQQRNPDMHVTGIYYHADEEGVPHVHLDFIPVATGFKRGLSVQNSFSRALDSLGFHGPKAGAEWYASENRKLESICEEHGLEVEHPEAGTGVNHLQKEKYELEQDIAKLEGEIKDDKKQIASLTEECDSLRNRVFDLKTESDSYKSSLNVLKREYKALTSAEPEIKKSDTFQLFGFTFVRTPLFEKIRVGYEKVQGVLNDFLQTWDTLDRETKPEQVSTLKKQRDKAIELYELDTGKKYTDSTLERLKSKERALQGQEHGSRSQDHNER